MQIDDSYVADMKRAASLNTGIAALADRLEEVLKRLARKGIERPRGWAFSCGESIALYWAKTHDQPTSHVVVSLWVGPDKTFVWAWSAAQPGDTQTLVRTAWAPDEASLPIFSALLELLHCADWL